MKRLSTEPTKEKPKGQNMYYQVTFWKNIENNDESKADAQTIMAFAHKTGFGVTSLKLQAEQPQVVYQQEPYIEPEAEVEPA